ncbi:MULTISPECIES: ABC transporter ATP-binding protein [Actinomyces]|uniref:ABC transporter ATP-binding protein n=1 Tax=Actinomyces respiraculi TaxID=2744574 RepID=A0A7T0LL87_9ACTO|nr:MULTISPECIES: ABC transporter ATP-binding protein [Actinomyces]QPL05413.1 ABC transporter ATP-binding protein [Actinomyces respiraculi]
MAKQSELTQQIQRRSWLPNVLNAVALSLDVVPPVLVVVALSLFWEDELDVLWIWWIAAITALVLTVKAFVVFVAVWRSHRVAYGALAHVRLGILEHLRRVPLGFFQRRRVGDLANVMKNDVEQVEVYLAHGLPETIAVTVIPIVVGIAVLVVDWAMGLAMLIGLPMMWLLKKAFSAQWAQGFAVVGRYTTTMQEALTEYVANIPVIKAFGRSETKTDHAIKTSQDYVLWVTKSMNSVSVPMGLIAMSMESGFVASVLVGLLRLQAGMITVERMIVAMILAATFTATVAKSGTLQHYFFMFNQAMKSIGAILDAPVAQFPRQSAPVPAGDVVFADVTFTYPDEFLPVCRRVDLTAMQGTTTALVGASGCGKSTLMSLLMGFWEPDSGQITVGSVSARQASAEQWGRLFSLVSQEVFLFNLSIADNIRIGNPQATQSQIEQAARQARIHDFIMGLPEGYDTMAGEAGVRFSGGEKQRLSIARALLKDAPIIILDEATSALDGENEKLINAALAELSAGKTVFMIAHRLHSVKDADQIVVIDHGQVVAAGTHEDLLGHCLMYRELVEAQNQVDSWDMKASNS